MMSWIPVHKAMPLNYPDGTAVPNQPDPPREIPSMMGWECPRCRTIHGPFVQKCDCPPPVKTWVGTGTGNW